MTQSGDTDNLVSSQVIANVLLKEPRDPEEVYLAWILCCFIPWARTSVAASSRSTSKFPKTVAAIAAREGIKADNKVTKIVEEAVLYLPDVIMAKGDAIDQSNPASKNSKQKQFAVSRERHGKAIRQWGPHWRSTVIFALLVQTAQAQNQSGRSIKESQPNLTRNVQNDWNCWTAMLHGSLASCT